MILQARILFLFVHHRYLHDLTHSSVFFQTHFKMSGRVRTRVDRGTGEIVAYSDAAVRNNLAVIEYCRTSMAALSGATAGKQRGLEGKRGKIVFTRNFFFFYGVYLAHFCIYGERFLFDCSRKCQI